MRIYAPTDPAALYLFEQRVLQTPSAIARFREQLGNASGSFTAPIQQLSTFPMLRAVLRDFETAQGNAPVGAIAFAPLSQVFGQCTVYPLALVADGNTQAVSPLVNDDGTAITPQTNLCDRKGSYFPNGPAFRQQQYPLAVPVSVVFRRDRWLSAAGLVPQRDVGE